MSSLSLEDVEPALQDFHAHQAEILALLDGFPGIASGYRRSATKFLESLFSGLDRPGDVKRTFVEGQRPKTSTI